MFVNTEGVTYVHLKVVNTEGVTFRSVHKPIDTTTEQIKGFVTPADHPSAVGSGAHSLLRSAPPLAPPPQIKGFLKDWLSILVSLCRCRSVSVDPCLSRSVSSDLGLSVSMWFSSLSISVDFGPSVDQCPSRSLCLSISVYLSLSLSLSPLRYIKNGSLLH